MGGAVIFAAMALVPSTRLVGALLSLIWIPACLLRWIMVRKATDNTRLRVGLSVVTSLVMVVLAVANSPTPAPVSHRIPTPTSTPVALAPTNGPGATAPPAAARPSDPGYAQSDYELGVPNAVHTLPCPTEVALYVAFGTAMTGVTVNARGPVHLTILTTLINGQTQTRTADLDTQHAQTMANFLGVNAADIGGMRVTASDGGNGAAGSCFVQEATNTGPTDNQACRAKHWPRAIPIDVIGLSYDDAEGSMRELECFKVTTARSTIDGHDVGTDTIYTHQDTSIVSTNPPSGTLVRHDQPISLAVTPIN